MPAAPSSGASRGGVFISYCHADAPRNLLNALRINLSHQYEVRLDEAIDPGQNWRDTLQTWLYECAAAVLILTPNATTSKWVPVEAFFAKSRYVTTKGVFKVIPLIAGGLRVEDLQKTPLEPAGISELQSIHVSDDDPETVDRVVARVIAVLGADKRAVDNRWLVRAGPPPALYPSLVEAGIQPILETLEVERRGDRAVDVPVISVHIPGYTRTPFEVVLQDLKAVREGCWRLKRQLQVPGLALPPSVFFDDYVETNVEVRVEGRLVASEPVRVLPTDHIGVDSVSLAAAALHIDPASAALAESLADLKPAAGREVELLDAILKRLCDKFFAVEHSAPKPSSWDSRTKSFSCRMDAPLTFELERCLLFCAALEHLGQQPGLVAVTGADKEPRFLVALSFEPPPAGKLTMPLRPAKKPALMLALDGDGDSLDARIREATTLFDGGKKRLLLSVANARALGLFRQPARRLRTESTGTVVRPMTPSVGDRCLAEIIELLSSPDARHRPVLVLGDSLDPTVAPSRDELAAMLSGRAGLNEPNLRAASSLLMNKPGVSLSSLAAAYLRSRSARSRVNRDLLRLPFSAIISLHPDPSLELEATECEFPTKLFLGNEDLCGWKFNEGEMRSVYLLGGSARTEERLCLTWSDEERLCYDLEQAGDIRYLMSTRPVVLLGCDLEARVLKELMAWLQIHVDPDEHQLFIVGEKKLSPFWKRWSSTRTTDIKPAIFIAELCRHVRPGSDGDDSLSPRVSAAEFDGGGRQTPYKFLDSYGPEDEGLFCGRDEDGKRLRYELMTSRNGLTVLSGPSGIGKTSLVRALLIPQLERERGALTVYCRFGSDPQSAVLTAFAAALGRAAEPPQGTFAETFERLLGSVDSEVLVVVDQLEEAIILRGESGVRRFMDDLQQLLAVRRPSVRVLIVIREDYLGWLAHFYHSAIESTFRLTALSREAAREAILEPARLFSVDIEDGFVDAVLDDLSPGQVLPASLQIVLDQTLRAGGDKRRLDLQTYREQLGGTARILREHLDNVLRTIESERRTEVRNVLQALVTSQETNAIRATDELLALTGLPEQTLATTIHLLVHGQRLVREVGQGGHQFELVHDSLGPSVMRWLEENDRLGKVTRERLERAIEDGYGTPDRPLERDLLLHVDKYRDAFPLGIATESVVTSWAVQGGFIGDWWGEVAEWSASDRYRVLVTQPLMSDWDVLSRVLRGDVGANVRRLGGWKFPAETADALAEYVLGAPYDILDRAVLLCLQDTSHPSPAAITLIQRLDHAPEMVRAGVRQSLLVRPVTSATMLSTWLVSGVLGLRCVLLLRHKATRDEQTERAAKLWLYRRLLVGQINSVPHALLNALLDPLQGIVAALRRRILVLGWREFFNSFAWELANDLLAELSSYPGSDTAKGSEWKVTANSLASAMSRCVEFVYRAIPDSHAEEELNRLRARLKDFLPR